MFVETNWLTLCGVHKSVGFFKMAGRIMREVLTFYLPRYRSEGAGKSKKCSIEEENPAYMDNQNIQYSQGRS